MLISKNQKITKCAGAIDDSRRYAVANILTSFKRGVMAATDGRVLAEIPFTVLDGEEDLDDVLIPADAVKLAQSQPKTFGHRLNVNGSITVLTKSGSQSFEPGTGEFPDYESVMRDPEDDDLVLDINAEYLWRIAQALGSPQVSIRLTQSGFKNYRDKGKPFGEAELSSYNEALMITAVPFPDSDEPSEGRAALMPITTT